MMKIETNQFNYYKTLKNYIIIHIEHFSLERKKIYNIFIKSYEMATLYTYKNIRFRLSKLFFYLRNRIR